MRGYILLGSPGAGKGTIGQFLHDTCGMDHFSSGDLLRLEISTKTAIGKKIETKINCGEQVSDNVITGLVLNRIKRLVASNKSFVLDGFPQTLPQKEKLTLFSNRHNIEIKYICVTVNPEIALDRMIHRVTCSFCNTIFSNKKETIDKCVKCSGKLVVRKSDKLEFAIKRLKQFQKTTKYVMDDVKRYFHSIEINGNNSIEAIRYDLLRSIKLASKL